jgi:hypothetical protein
LIGPSPDVCGEVKSKNVILKSIDVLNLVFNKDRNMAKSILKNKTS